MPTKDQEAARLANMHYEIEEGMTQIFRVTGSADSETLPNEPIKLLEVNENTIPAGIMPIHFGASPSSGLNFSCVIIEVTPDEFQEIQDHRLVLPNNWRLGEQFPRPTQNNVG